MKWHEKMTTKKSEMTWNIFVKKNIQIIEKWHLKHSAIIDNFFTWVI